MKLFKEIKEYYPIFTDLDILSILKYYVDEEKDRNWNLNEMDCILTFLNQSNITINPTELIISHPCLLTSKLRVSKENAIEYLDYTEEDFE